MCRFPFVKEWFNEMQTAKNGESKRETSEAYLGSSSNGTSLCITVLLLFASSTAWNRGRGT